MKKKPSSSQSNKYAALALPERQLDFHQYGKLTSAQILQEIELFLKKAHHDNLKKILIITGKGLHSADGQSVIRPLVQEYLRKNELVKTFSYAPINQGGEGAILVMLT